MSNLHNLRKLEPKILKYSHYTGILAIYGTMPCQWDVPKASERTMIDMQKRKKLLVCLFSAIILIAVSFGIWWVFPTHFLGGVSPEEIAVIEVFNGNDGNRLEVTAPEDISFLTKSIQSVPMKKDSIAMGMGTTYNLRFLAANGQEIDRFIIMDSSTVRSGLVFYECDGQLRQAEDYLIELEKALFPDTQWVKNQNRND